MTKAHKLDVKETIRSKNPKLLKWIPPFVIGWIKRIIHEERINGILERSAAYQGLEFVGHMVHNEFKIRYRVHNIDHFPEDSRFILASNHPWGAMEALSLMDMVGQKYQEPRFIVNDVLMAVKNFHPLFLPVNKHGAQARSNAVLLDETYRSERPVLIFPAGLVSRRVKGQIKDPQWKSNFISKAIQYKRDVIPVFVDGTNSSFFYNLANFRKAIGIKANIEMFFLPDEMMKNSNKKLPIYIGKPISYKVFDNSRTKNEWAFLVQEYCYNIKNTSVDFLTFVKTHLSHS